MITFPGIIARLTTTLIILYIGSRVQKSGARCSGVVMIRCLSLIVDNPLINTNSIKTNNNNNTTHSVIMHRMYRSTYSSSPCCARNPNSTSVKHPLYIVVRHQLSDTHYSNQIQYNKNTVRV